MSVNEVVTPPQDGIRAFDAYGREVIVPREQWIANVLPGILKESWGDPERLYMALAMALRDGFVAELGPASEHLYEIDPIPVRGACIRGIVLLQSGDLDGAEAVFQAHTEKYGEDPAILTNLAKVYADRGRAETCEATLRRALALDPNFDNALGWLAAIVRERDGEDAVLKLMSEMAEAPASWRPQMWLARAELAKGNLSGAKARYAQALARVERPVPADMLMQMSGDLGQAGLLDDLIEMTGPLYLPEAHGLPVGNNLIKANVDRGNFEAAEQIKSALWALNRPDWKDALAFWDTEIARLRVAGANANGAAVGVEIGLLSVEAPIWLAFESPARGLFAAKAANAPTVAFFGGTAERELDDTPDAARFEISDTLGRLTRSLPLFLAEQAEMRTAVRARAILPWAATAPAGSSPGFVVSGMRWPDETALQAVATPPNQSDYVVTVHIDAETRPWIAELVFIRTHDRARIGELQGEVSPDSSEDGIKQLAGEVVELLQGFGESFDSGAYVPPTGSWFEAYLLRQEQLLAVRCASMGGVAPQFLSGEREILLGNLDLCLAIPANVPTRLLLMETVRAMEQARPAVAAEFRPKLAHLEQQQPLASVDRLYASTPS